MITFLVVCAVLVALWLFEPWIEPYLCEWLQAAAGWWVSR